MVQIGKFNTLEVLKELDFGMYLDGKELGEILLPVRYIPEGLQIGESVEVFIYKDSEDRLIATTEIPFAQVGEFAFLSVNSTNRIGAFMDWGLMKDLLVPFREQKTKMMEDRSYTVYVYLDQESQRIVASAKIEKFLDNVLPEYELNEEVSILVYQRTDLGFKVIVDNKFSGMIYFNEIFCDIRVGDTLPAYVKYVRDDQKIDVSLQPLGYEQRIDPLTETILEALDDNDGFLPLSDKSPVEKIEEYFSCSKKAFKKAIGALYKKRIIEIKENGIFRVQK
ncbi:MAG: CvfB family protein [Bacteroidales bacterium]